MYVACAVDSKHGRVAIKFSYPSVIDKEFAILLQLQDANIPGIARVYGSCWVDRFRGISLELFTNSLATIGTMELEKVVVMGKGMVRVRSVLLHSFGLRPLFRFLHCRRYTTSASSITTSNPKISLPRTNGIFT